MQERDRFTEALLRDDLRRLNSHLPKTRRTLKELLEDPSPTVPSISGQPIKMKKNELHELLSSLGDSALERMRLPVILLRRTDFGPGAFAILGDLYEEYAMLRLAGSFSGTFEEFGTRAHSPTILYKPQVSLLLRKIHSLITIGFGTSEALRC